MASPDFTLRLGRLSNYEGKERRNCHNDLRVANSNNSPIGGLPLRSHVVEVATLAILPASALSLNAVRLPPAGLTPRLNLLANGRSHLCEPSSAP
jgi:hypothetical protein